MNEPNAIENRINANPGLHLSFSAPSFPPDGFAQEALILANARNNCGDSSSFQTRYFWSPEHENNLNKLQKWFTGARDGFNPLEGAVEKRREGLHQCRSQPLCSLGEFGQLPYPFCRAPLSTENFTGREESAEGLGTALWLLPRISVWQRWSSAAKEVPLTPGQDSSAAPRALRLNTGFAIITSTWG